MILYICPESYRCHNRDGCGHSKPHKHKKTCVSVCSLKPHLTWDSGRLYQVKCVPIPNETFIEESEFEL